MTYDVSFSFRDPNNEDLMVLGGAGWRWRWQQAKAWRMVDGAPYKTPFLVARYSKAREVQDLKYVTAGHAEYIAKKLLYTPLEVLIDQARREHAGSQHQ
jgi:hypothetical protein